MTIETAIPQQATIRQTPGNIVSDMDGEKVMLNVQLGKYFNLGEIGGRVWELIGNVTTVEALVDQLTAEYAVERETCEAHVRSFLAQLSEQQLITVSAAGGPDERA
ncbi:lasso peptide biosynthesis PqqD family chaperone [Cohnella hashimotonis]|uniref:Lasso peptide biosynthesis PqqD family chaperone n=1 Tax=Cohnella hashimotonis TaxID=2826895 RepID=A0ABT6TBV8_9BACL|nr:lasso peptide biosynthesis PqqD family chaperone [Cohnella hashimotonis]MDI4644150.1 lasso peptide biosynthesis PqqD family chaperone [Cohnella hashimotonis]